MGTPLVGGRAGLIRFVGNDELDQQAANDKLTGQPRAPPKPTDLGAFVRTQWTIMRNHRNTGDDSLSSKLLRAQRMFEGRYDPSKLAEIGKFGGSQVYSRLVASKCRGATSLLRDVYLGAERPWDIDAQEDPPVPPEILQNIMQLIGVEVQTQQQAGQGVAEPQVHARILGLVHAAQQAARRQADMRANAAATRIDDMLVQGKFYQAMAEFLVDLPLFPFACLKGPVVRMVPQLSWSQNPGQPSQPVRALQPQMFWERVSPFNLYWSPGASSLAEADVIERHRLSRSDLNDMLGLPGFDEQAVRGALRDYRSGLADWMDGYDSERAFNEGRESPVMNQSQLIDAIEYHGQVQGTMLLEQGMDPRLVPDPDRDYAIQTWVVGEHVLKTQLTPSPRQRHPYYATSFEKAPGTVAGHALPDLLEDIQEACNATLRSLVNNLSISSGPQVVINDDAVAPGENSDDLYPWKRWHTQSDPMDPNKSGVPVTFFQPQSNATELLGVYTAMTNMADEISAIPRYITGSSQGLGAAGRTASGLSMLMGNASKVLQTVAANVDNDVIEPALSGLYDMILLTDPQRMLTGEESIRVRGVNVAVQKETEHNKQLQFLQITANPIDAPIIGEMGRARVLRAVAQGLGLPDDVVPDDQTLQAKMDAASQMQTAAAALAPHQPGTPGAPGQPQPPGAPGKPGKPGQTSAIPPGAAPAAQAQGNQAPAAPPASPSDVAQPVNLQQQGLPYHAP